MTHALAALVLAALGTLALALVRARRESARLRERVETATQQLERLQRGFESFAPGALVERIAASGTPAQGERREVTVLFADLVGFTRLAESVEPDVLVRIVNGYFERMGHAIADHHGHVSNLIGDGILALFGALEPNPWHSDDAVRATLAMRAALADYNDELQREGLPRLAIGMALHRGVGIAGVVGSAQLMQFTVVGRVVNIAARVQALTRMHAVDVLLTGPVQAAIDPGFALRRLPASRVRGIDELLQIYALAEAEPGRREGDYAV